jgi:hypothetical protein
MQQRLDLYDMTQSASVFVTKDILIICHTLTCHVLSVLTKSIYWLLSAWEIITEIIKGI